MRLITLTLLISSLSSACIQMGLFSAADRQTGEVVYTQYNKTGKPDELVDLRVFY